jgi:hypothetical protein
MDDHVIDCCSLLNLYTGWRGLAELRDLRRTWHVCDAVLDEAEYTREYGPDGAHVTIPLDIGTVVRDGLLLPARPETEVEIEDYVTFAMEIDDGEAQALSIAKNRGYVLLTDDRKAARVASRPDVGVRTTSTVEILRTWAGQDRRNEARLREVITRITSLARFRPKTESPDYNWWGAYLR